MDINKEPLITFVIPTLNRKSLIRTLESLQKLKESNWLAICVFDHIQPGEEALNKLNSDSRFSYIVLYTKLGEGHHSAGNVRNEGIKLVRTPWVGFVDDDDWLIDTYITKMKKELECFPMAECILFRMIDKVYLVPRAIHNDVQLQFVGISFCCKTNVLLNGMLFKPSNCEDFELIDRLKSNNVKIIISPYIVYQCTDTDKPNDVINILEKHNTRSLLNINHDELSSKSLFAIYGAKNKYVDVTRALWNDFLFDGLINMPNCEFNNHFGDPCINTVKTLYVYFQDVKYTVAEGANFWIKIANL